MKFHNGRVELWDGDCRDVLAGFDPDKFDACVTDPPYHFASIVKRFGKTSLADETQTSDRSRRGLDGYARAARGFMGKQWDGGQIAHDPATWAAVLRVLKPGAHLVAFHAPKNWHRLACAIEDAGFEVRDTLLWIFGSGFPKSHNAGRAIAVKTCKLEGRHFESSLPRGDARQPGDHICPPTPESEPWEVWGSALKPAYEPIVLARKPLIGTIAETVMQHGTGAININACRVGNGEPRQSMTGGMARKASPVYGSFERTEVEEITTTLGRWPANVVHDGSPEVVEGFPNAESWVAGGPSERRRNNGLGLGGNDRRDGLSNAPDRYADSGSASRFFYTAKADAGDRFGSKHPTVKPLDLMQWLVRLVTPPRGHVLDCFAGTGTTAEACLREGFRCTLIEREAEYLADIDRRMAHVFDGEVGRSVAMAKLKKEEGEAPLLDYLAEAAE